MSKGKIKKEDSNESLEALQNAIETGVSQRMADQLESLWEIGKTIRDKGTSATLQKRKDETEAELAKGIGGAILLEAKSKMDEMIKKGQGGEKFEPSPVLAESMTIHAEAMRKLHKNPPELDVVFQKAA